MLAQRAVSETLVRGLVARGRKSIAKNWRGGAGEKSCQWVGGVRKSRAVEDQSAPIPEKVYEQAWKDD